MIFFKKRKKDIESPVSIAEEVEEEVETEEPKKKKSRKVKIEEEVLTESSGKKEKEEAGSEGKASWFESEGQLAVDVYQTSSEVVIQAPIAGVDAENLEISIENDMLTIRGSREKPEDPDEERSYFYQECYWGPFVRKIILSEEVDPGRAEAKMKQGILTLRIPKIERKAKRKIMVKE